MLTIKRNIKAYQGNKLVARSTEMEYNIDLPRQKQMAILLGKGFVDMGDGLFIKVVDVLGGKERWVTSVRIFANRPTQEEIERSNHKDEVLHISLD